MKISNKYVEIKMGNKKYRKQNMILNTYLKRIFDMQINDNHNVCLINRCYLKLDTPIENVDYNTELDGLLDFDVFIYPSYNENIISNKNTISLNYKFDDSRYMYNGKNFVDKSFSQLNRRKITAIGFGMNRDCFTFLDTDNMNIFINTNEDFLISRLDIIRSDGVADKIEYPLHLINDTARKDAKTIVDGDYQFLETTMAKLYSVGFGNTIGLMEEEYLIDNVETSRDDFSITFDVLRTKKIGHYPSENLHFSFYPTMDNSKYLIFKYRLYRRYYNSNTEQYVITDLDKYYTMSKPNENFGNLEIKLSIERL